MGFYLFVGGIDCERVRFEVICYFLCLFGLAMQTVVISSLSGGQGKTTVTLLLARELLRRRYRPLLRIRHALDAFKSGTTWTQGRLMNMNQHPQPATTRHLRVLGRALTKLSSDQRQTLRLLITEGLSKEEASLRMGVTPGLVEAWASSGLERLTERMCNNDQQIS